MMSSTYLEMVRHPAFCKGTEFGKSIVSGWSTGCSDRAQLWSRSLARHCIQLSYEICICRKGGSRRITCLRW